MSVPVRRQASEPADYEGLTGTFAEACREADHQYRRQQQNKFPASGRSYEIPESTRQAIDWLLKINDAKRLGAFIREHPQTEAKMIIRYINGNRK